MGQAHDDIGAADRILNQAKRDAEEAERLRRVELERQLADYALKQRLKAQAQAKKEDGK